MGDRGAYEKERRMASWADHLQTANARLSAANAGLEAEVARLRTALEVAWEELAVARDGEAAALVIERALRSVDGATT